MKPGQDPSWEFYAETILVLRLRSGSLSIDLRRPVAPAQRQRLEESDLPREFGVVTASNPVGGRLSAAENDDRRRQLHAEILQEGWRCIPADGVSPGEEHRERGFAIACSREAARELAQRFDQSAFFWFDGDAFWIVGALVATDPIRLPLESEDAAGVAALSN